MDKVYRIGHYKLPNRNWYKRDFTDLQAITVHHDAIPHSNRRDETILDQIKDTHVKKNWPGASYHFWIGRTGTVYQLNDIDWITWHDSKNTHSIGVCVTGYFHPPHNNKPDKRQLNSLYELINYLHEQYGKHLTVRGHRDVSSTACPGNELYPLIHNYKQSNKVKMYTYNIDGFGNIEINKDSLDEIKRFDAEYQKERDRVKDARKERDELKKTVEFLETEKENLETSVKKLKKDAKKLDEALAEQTVQLSGMVEQCQEQVTRANKQRDQFFSEFRELTGYDVENFTFVLERIKELQNRPKDCNLSNYSNSQLLSQLFKNIFGGK